MFLSRYRPFHLALSLVVAWAPIAALAQQMPPHSPAGQRPSPPQPVSPADAPQCVLRLS